MFIILIRYDNNSLKGDDPEDKRTLVQGHSVLTNMVISTLVSLIKDKFDLELSRRMAIS